METNEEKPRRTVKVACSIPNGVQLRLNEPNPDGSGEMRPKGHPVALSGPSTASAGAGAPVRTDLGPAITEVDEEFWKAWAE